MRKIFANDHLAGRAVNKPLLLIGGAASAALLAWAPSPAFRVVHGKQYRDG